jgi:phosphohistidine phosphatase
MELLIVRHAVAFERDRRRWREDGARPLSPAGMKLSRKAAAGLKAFCDPPDELLTSPLVRAQQTGQILTDIAGWPEAEVAPELSPDGSPSAVLDMLAGHAGKRIAIVGHQPALGELMRACLTSDGSMVPIEMKKNAVACVRFEGPTRAGRAVLKWLASPRLLRHLRHD